MGELGSSSGLEALLWEEPEAVFLGADDVVVVDCVVFGDWAREVAVGVGAAGAVEWLVRGTWVL